MRRVTILVCSIFLLAFVAGCGNKISVHIYDSTIPEETSETTGTEIEEVKLDKAIQNAIRLELGYSENVELTEEDFQSVTYLAIFEEEVFSLEGISMLGNLEELYINYGSFSDISELSKLSNIRRISISNSYIKNVPDFSNCTQLESIYLTSGLIEDIEPFGNIPSLRTLSLDYNRITSIEALADVHNLTFLIIDNNCILDYYTIQDNENLIAAINEGSQANFAQLIEVEEKAKEIVNGFGTDLSELELEEKIYSYIIDNMEYYDSMRSSGAFGAGGILEGRGVCGDYAQAFAMLASHAGIETYVCMSETHAWNIVEINGKYYHCDALWDEVEDEWKHFNVTEEYIRSLPEHDYDERYYPDCE